MSRKSLRIEMAEPIVDFTRHTEGLLRPRCTVVSSESPGHEQRLQLYEERAAKNMGIFDGIELPVECIDESQRTMFEMDDSEEDCELGSPYGPGELDDEDSVGERFRPGIEDFDDSE